MAESLHTHTLMFKTIVLDVVGPGPPSPHHAPQRQHPPSQAHWPHDTPYATHHNETRPSRNSTPRPAPQVCPPSPPIPPHAHTQAPHPTRTRPASIPHTIMGAARHAAQHAPHRTRATGAANPISPRAAASVAQYHAPHSIYPMEHIARNTPSNAAARHYDSHHAACLRRCHDLDRRATRSARLSARCLQGHRCQRQRWQQCRP